MSAGVKYLSNQALRRARGAARTPAKPEPLTLNPAETAVIVVDLQNAYASKNGYLDKAGFDVSIIKLVIENTTKVLETARAAGMPVVFLQNGCGMPTTLRPAAPVRRTGISLMPLKPCKQPELKEVCWLKVFGIGQALVDALKPQDGDIIVLKPCYSGFYNTNLDSTPRARGIRNLVFTGIATNVCVESTLRDGFHLEYFVWCWPWDAAYQAGPPDIHEASLFQHSDVFRVGVYHRAVL